MTRQELYTYLRQRYPNVHPVVTMDVVRVILRSVDAAIECQGKATEWGGWDSTDVYAACYDAVAKENGAP